MTQTPPNFVYVFFTVVMIGLVVGIIAIFISGVLLSFRPEIKDYWDDDEDDSRGGDEGFTPVPWSPTPDGIEVEEDELICQ